MAEFGEDEGNDARSMGLEQANHNKPSGTGCCDYLSEAINTEVSTEGDEVEFSTPHESASAMESQSQFSDPAAFLRLTPANLYAKIAFNDVVLLMNASRSNAHLQHARKFMEVQPYQHEIEISSPPVLEVENFSQSEVESEVSSSREPVIEYQGSYVLSFDVRPGLPQVGWIVGTGRWNLQKMETIPNSGADIQLAPPGPQFSKYGVAGKHAILYFGGNGTMSVRIVNSRRPKIMIDTEEFDEGSRGFTSRRHLISFGKLSYDMELVTLDEEKYQRNLRIYFTHYLRRPVPPPDISAFPSPWDLIFNNWIVKGTVGKGAFGSVNAAKHRLSGETAAAKCLVRNTKTWPRAAAEIDILKVLPRHVSLESLFRASNFQCLQTYRRDFLGYAMSSMSEESVGSLDHKTRRMRGMDSQLDPRE